MRKGEKKEENVISGKKGEISECVLITALFKCL